ncbi:MAG TPA: hypothetical protein VFO98_04720, partial [Marmoricola sp.]|nr:hypothetical protein [Marmoricola sp.]
MTTLLALVLMGGLPAVAGGAALAARAVGPDRPGVLLTRMLAAGVVTWTMGTGLLARTVGLSTTSVWTLAVALGLVSLVVIALPAQRRALRQGWRDLVQGVGVAALGLLTWAPVALLNKEVTWSVFAPTPWYYLGLARQTAEHGSVPATSMEWGTTAPFLDDYHLLTVGTASLIKVGPADGILAAHAV